MPSKPIRFIRAAELFGLYRGFLSQNPELDRKMDTSFRMDMVLRGTVFLPKLLYPPCFGFKKKSE